MEEPADKLLTGAQASEFLGVKSATLYAYASRGLIESIPSINARERCYRLSDLIRLRQSSRGFKTTKDSEAPVWTGPVIKSAITEIKNDGHRYRGQPVIELAISDIQFESIAELLWETENSAQIDWRAVTPLAVPSHVQLRAAPDTDYLDLLKYLLVSIEMDDPVSRLLMADGIFDTARRLIVTMSILPGISQGRNRYIIDAQYPIAQTLLAALVGSESEESARVVNRALVLCADHELNASALATRIAASCDSSLYSSLLSALGTFSGNLHGSASRRTEDMITNSLRFANAKAWLKDFLRQYPSIPGFGTELYSSGDPRAKLLIETAQSVSPNNEFVIRLNEIVECVREQLSLEPNLDVGLAAISHALSLPPGSGTTIFAVSRTAGWIAHAIEQRTYGGIIRPRARYIGKS